MIQLGPTPELELTPGPEAQRANWLIFGVGSPEPAFMGSHFNIGAAVIDLLADQAGLVLRETGPIQTALIARGQADIRIIKPNVVPEFADTAVSISKNNCKFDPYCVALIYGDPAFNAGSVKIKRKGGASGNKVISEFNSMFGQKSVVRIRVGIGPLKASRQNSRHEALDDCTPKLMRGVHIAAAVVRALVDEGYSKASDLANKASKGKVVLK